jgi:hypothetical protein
MDPTTNLWLDLPNSFYVHGHVFIAGNKKAKQEV